MTRTTELTPLLKSLNLGALAAKSKWITPHSWRSSSATRSIASPTVASNSGCTTPVSRRPAAGRLRLVVLSRIKCC